MARKFFLWLFLILICFSIGIAIAITELKNTSKSAAFMEWNGPWRVNPSMALKSKKQRALIAMVGLFALRETEVVYYSADVDSNGNPLSSAHDYKLVGAVPDARYWNYTLYGEDDFLIPNPDKIYSYNSSSITYEPFDSNNPEMQHIKSPTYEMHISKTSKDKNWLPSGDNKKIVITLRMYNPSKEVYQDLTKVPLPQIIRI